MLITREGSEHLIDPFTITVIGVTASGLAVSRFYRRCPNGSVLLIVKGGSSNVPSIRRIVRTGTWFNAILERAVTFDLSQVSLPITLKLSTANAMDLYMHCQLTTQVEDLDSSIKVAAIKGYGATEVREKQLKKIVERMPVTPDMLPVSMESFFTLLEERERSLVFQKLSETLMEDGFRLCSIAPRSITKSKTIIDMGSDESLCSKMLKGLNFEANELEIKIEIPARSPYWGLLYATWQVVFRAPSSLQQFYLCCGTFLDTNSLREQELLTAAVDEAIHNAFLVSGSGDFLERALKPLANLPLNFSCGREAAVALLNVLADSLSSWRGKLSMSRLALDGMSTLIRFDKEIDLQAERSFSTLGLRLEKISLLSLQSNEKSIAWQGEPDGAETILRPELSVPIKVDAEEMTLLIKCVICLEPLNNGDRLNSNHNQAELEQLIKVRLQNAFLSPKVPQTLRILKRQAENIQSQFERTEPAAAWGVRLEHCLKSLGPASLAFGIVRILFASLETYADVRKRFLAESNNELLSHGLDLKYFTLVDIDLLDSESKSVFPRLEQVQP